ncbi:C39 family peptidase [Micromonospora aurantiaca]|uniref:C39 family peptidase n=1 Tax=Micromonospora aurantiaca (nom. illeg.) TaxID=47850 RepID=A0A1C6TNK6_9ACTN|nr:MULTISPECIES: C39 family peptidase [Micromonospora]AXH93628.1 phytochelatin synthase [Micromonospora aurantiaca]KAB1118675.1 C39 family peptidase [Micromonospora aurantiaca]MBC8992551.1 C39 family peptidase [Micromonospora chalcea]MCT2280407.1 C39 family peptidase [Micromonospora chalcea]MDG4752764.1 C39 family peptidase [Micromonospora sp. WMMD718]
MNNPARRFSVSNTHNSAVVRKCVAAAGVALAGIVAAGPATAAFANPAAAEATARAASGKQVNDYTFQAQPNIYYCGPASTRIALSAQGKIEDQDKLASELGTTFAGTASAFEITRVLNDSLGEREYKTVEIPNESASADEVHRLRADLTKAIDEQRIPVVNVIGAAVGAEGVTRSFPVGHYLTVVGYDSDGGRLKIADPWQPVGDGTYWISAADLANWSASRGYSA